MSSIARQMMMAAAGGAGGGAAPLTHSLSFNGSSALYNSNVPSTVWGSNLPYTYEAWINPMALNGYRAVLGKQYSSSGGMAYVLDSSLAFYQSGTVLDAGVMSSNVWYHVAITRDLTGMRAYLNGANVSSNAFVGNVTATEIYVGGASSSSGPPNIEFFSGLIARPRVSNIVRYTGNFTPSTDYENDENSIFYVDVLDGVITELNGIPLSSVGSPGISTNTPA